MSIKTYSDTVIIQDALTGEVVLNIPLKLCSYSTIEAIVSDLVMGDIEEKHGFIVKYGYNAKAL